MVSERGENPGEVGRESKWKGEENRRQERERAGGELGWGRDTERDARGRLAGNAMSSEPQLGCMTSLCPQP